MKNDSIVLNSRPFPGQDFKIVDSILTKNNYTTVKIENPNTALYRFVYCFLKISDRDTLLNANENGLIILPDKTDTINLLFKLSSERLSTFVVNHSMHNSYTFNFEPWAVEVFFKQFCLTLFTGSS